MQYNETPPSAPLAGFVKSYWTLRQSASPVVGLPEPVIPDGCIELIFNLADPFRRYHTDGTIELQPRALVAGQMRFGAVIEPTGQVDILGVRFHPAGAFPFFPLPLNELTDQIIDLDLAWGARGRELSQYIGDARTDEARIAAVERGLMKWLRSCGEDDRLVGLATDLIVRGRGATPIEQLAVKMNLSPRRLERRFLTRVGLSPKSFSRIVRFQHFVNSTLQTPDLDVLGLALLAGYYDQSHLIHECRKFTGKSPTEFFAREHKLSDAFLSDMN